MLKHLLLILFPILHPSATPLIVTFPNQEKILDLVKFKKMKAKFLKEYQKI